MPDPAAPPVPGGPPPSPLVGARPATLRDLITAEAKQQRIPPELAFAMVDQESGGDPTATSGKGAHGLFQLMPATAAELGVDLTDPVQNIRGGLTYLRRMLDQHKGDVGLALAAYNAGPGAVAKAGGIPNFPETQQYVQKILARLQGKGSAPAGAQPAGAQPAKPLLGRAPATAVEPALALSSETAGKIARGEGGQIGQPPPLSHPAPPEIAEPFGATPIRVAGQVGQAIAESFDPRTPEGRQNIAGGVGAAAGTAIAAGTGGLGAAAVPVLGAATAGLYENLGEQVVGTIPPSEMAALAAGGTQGLYEVGGQLLPYAAKAIGRRVLASSVGKAASEALTATRTATMAKLQGALDAASATAGQVKTLAGQTVRKVRQQAAGALRGARKTAADDVVTAEGQAAAGTAAAEAPYTSLVGQAPKAALVGQQAQAVIRGPAQAARDLVGQQVEEAAKAGPPVSITTLKQEAQQILDQIAIPQQTFPREAAEAAGTALPQGMLDPTQVAQLEQRVAAGGPDAATAAARLATREQALKDLAAAQGAAQQLTLQHPALGVIQRILNADDIVPFHALHLWKSELQNALAGSYDKAVNKRVTSITQKLAGEMRGALAGHEPYNQATAAYQQIVPLYTKEYAAAFRKVAQTNPEALVHMITPDKPTAARMLRDLLVTQSAEGGKAAEGQAAWDGVRSAWTHRHVLEGGIGQLDARLAKLTEGTGKEFADIFYGDANGQAVLQNLRQIASAYKAAGAAGETGIAAAKASGKTDVQSMQRVGERQVEQATQGAEAVRQQAAADIRGARRAVQVGRRPTLEEARFRASSVAGRQPTKEELGAHAVRAFALGPLQVWGGLSWFKLLTGPQEKHLLEWAAYSPANTQRLVRLMTGPSPTGATLADLMRSSGILEEKGPSKVGQPPPR